MNAGIIDNIGYEQRMDLSGRCRWQYDWNSLRCYRVRNYLYLEWCKVRWINSNWTYFKTIQKRYCCVSRDVSVDERQEGDNALTWIAARERSCVELIISGFNLWRSFRQEWKGYLGPASIAPVSPDNEWDNSKVIRVDCFDRKEKVGTVLAFQIIHSCVKQ